MFQIMIFLFLFFVGILVLFWSLYKKLDAQTRTLGDEHAQLRVLLRAMESRLDKLMQLERISKMLQEDINPADLPEENTQENDTPAHDPLLHLSFDQPANPGKLINPGLDLNMDAQPEWSVAQPINREKKD